MLFFWMVEHVDVPNFGLRPQRALKHCLSIHHRNSREPIASSQTSYYLQQNIGLGKLM